MHLAFKRGIVSTCDNFSRSRLQELIDTSCIEDPAVYAYLLKGCGKLAAAALTEGRRLHQHVAASKMSSDLILSNHIISMYGKCGSPEEAMDVFNGMTHKNVASWGTMISAYAHNGYFKEAMNVFYRMQLEGVVANRSTFITVLNTCTSFEVFPQGKMIHSCVCEIGLDENVVVATAILSMYSKCGRLKKAKQMFDSIDDKDTVTWNAMLTTYAHYGQHPQQEAIHLYREMLIEGVKPTNVTYVSLLQTCESPEDLTIGQLLHQHITAAELASDTVVATALIDMYGNCGDSMKARMVFDGMNWRDTISWNAMLTAYVRQGNLKDTRNLYHQMPGENHTAVTYVCMLSACVDIDEGLKIVSAWKCKGFDSDVFDAAVINMYGRCGKLNEACQIFDNMGKKTSVTWTAIIGASGQCGDGKQALKLLKLMLLEGVKLTNITMTAAIHACGVSTLVNQSKLVHAIAIESGYMGHAAVGNAIIDMYGKCGRLEEANAVFSRLPKKNAIAWTSLVSAFAHVGRLEDAVKHFTLMQQDGMKICGIAFVNIIWGCSHVGRVEEGIKLFVAAREDYEIEWSVDHYSCLIDLLARGGRLKDAEDVMRRLPWKCGIVQWMSLLSGCRCTSKDAAFGERIANNIFQCQEI